MRRKPIAARWRATTMTLLAASGVALTVPFAHARDVKPDELPLLSPICQAAFGRSGSWKERLRGFESELAGTCGIQHTCNGELAMIRYRRLALTRPPSSDSKKQAKYKRQLKGSLQRVIGEYSYEIRCAPPTYPLLPMIHTERGKAHSLLGETAAAIRDFARALELDPDYAPARHGLAAAQARAGVPSSSR